jgi:putative ABC transport system ATP-binding protein
MSKNVRELNQDYGKTIVIVAHDPLAASFAHKVHHLEKGVLLPERQVPSDWAQPMAGRASKSGG